MLKILHVHTDTKFVNDSAKYASDKIENCILFLGSERIQNPQLSKLSFNYRFIDIGRDDWVNEAAHECNEFDIIVFFDLCNNKIKLIEATDKKNGQIFIHRLFGYELYNKVTKRYISRQTFDLLYPQFDFLQTPIAFLKSWLSRSLLWNIKLKRRYKGDMYKKIDYISLINEFEYQELSRYFDLPPFIKIPFAYSRDLINIGQTKNREIIIGNSRHFWNNHLDVWREVKDLTDQNLVRFVLFFSYGKEGRYARLTRRLFSAMPNVHIINDFLTVEEFRKVYKQASALVINSYRQHAIGNIMTAMLKGCKIYLNKRSSTYDWLIANGFHIAELNSLRNDIITDQVTLNGEEAKYNIDKCFEIQNSYNQEAFVEILLKLQPHKLNNKEV